MSLTPKSARVLAALLLLPWLGACELNIQFDSNDEQTPSLERMIGQMLVVGFRGKSVAPGDPIARDITERHLGGVVLYDYDVPSASYERNIESPPQLRTLIDGLQDLADGSLLVGVDQEGGYVNRLKERYGFPPTPSQAYYGELDDPAATREGAAVTAATLAEMGFTVNFAPVVDLNTNPDNPVIGAIDRSYGADPQKVVTHAMAAIGAHHSKQVLTTLKHFPGHGSSRDDSHLGFVDVTHTWSADELEPYRALIDMQMADLVMTAHIYNQSLDPDYPATLSRATIDGLLRGQLGFDGVVISDDMQMGAISQYYGLESAIELAVNAGVDMLVFANNSTYNPDITAQAVAIIRALVEEGRIARTRIEQAYGRICRMKNRYRDGDERLDCAQDL